MPFANGASNYADRKADIAQNALERRIQAEYTAAYESLKEMAQSYLDELEAREKQVEALLAQGKIDIGMSKDADDYMRQWRLVNAARGAHWEALRDDMARRLVDTDKLAASYINDATPGIYSLFANWTAYTVEKSAPDAADVAFNLVDERTVRRLLVEDPELLPFNPATLDMDKDELWNRKKLNSAVTGSILKGDGIKELSNAFMRVVGMDMASAIRNSRTAMTGARNGGCLDSLRAASGMGIDVQKQWVSTMDKFTRHTHVQQDGEVRPLNERFSNGCMMPGDPSGAPGEVYNCRCAMVGTFPNSKNPKLNGIDYQKWCKERRAELEEQWEQERQKNRKKKPEPEAKPKHEILTRAQAEKELKDICGFDRVEPGLKRIPDDLLIAQVAQLEELESRFGAIHSSEGFITGTKERGNAMAYVSRRMAEPSKQSLYLCGRDYDMAELIAAEEMKARDTFFSMPFKDGKELVYTVTHEYGHMLENILMERHWETIGWDKSNPGQYMDFTKRTKKAIVKWYTKETEAFQKSVYTEVVGIAKANNPNFSLQDNLSRYGRTNYAEFFAETFANSQCGAPNELGNAMQEWLVKKGF